MMIEMSKVLANKDQPWTFVEGFSFCGEKGSHLFALPLCQFFLPYQFFTSQAINLIIIPIFLITVWENIV
jgi:hypothetical protein